MNARKWISLFVMLGISGAAFGGTVDGIAVAHYEPLERVSTSTGRSQFSQKPSGIGPIDLRFDALGKAFDLALVPNASLLAALPGSSNLEDGVPYRGHIAGVPGSWARVVMVNGMPAGLIWDGNDLYALEVPGDSVVDAAGPIVYRLSDTVISPGALSCATEAVAASGSSVFESVVADLGAAVAQAPGAFSELSVGAVGDYEFTSAKGANARDAILTRLNNVDGIFSQQLGVQITVPFVETFTDVNDPFSNTTDPGTLLNEVGAYRAGSPQQSVQGLTHLYTGRDLSGTTVGIAFTGALCSFGNMARFGAGLSEGNGSSAFDSLVTAHEMGHNFGAPHDGDPQEACASEPDTFLMAPRLNSSDQFSACSIGIMQQSIAGASCINPLPSTDVSVSFSDASTTVMLSNDATVTIDVVNVGTNLAQNVVADVTLPTNVSFVSASSGTGTCTNGAGTVSCQFGDVAGAAVRQSRLRPTRLRQESVLSMRRSLPTSTIGQQIIRTHCS